jgi:hypothetical protein
MDAYARVRRIWILSDIRRELEAQDTKWGLQNHPNGTGLRRDKELADRARALCDEAASSGALTFRHILTEEFFEAVAESDPGKLYTELIQVAAVAAQWAEKIKREHSS